MSDEKGIVVSQTSHLLSPATCKVEGSRVDDPPDENEKARDLVTCFCPFFLL